MIIRGIRTKIKNSIRSIYRAVKNWSFWEKNSTTIFIYKVIRKIFWIAFKVRDRLKRIWKKILLSLGLLGMYRRIRRNANRRGLYLQLARFYSGKKNWDKSKNYWLKLSEMTKENSVEVVLKNEIKLNLSFINRLENFDKYKNQIDAYNKAVAKKKPKIAVVSAVSGGYDNLKLPAVLNSDYNYIMYTDTPMRSSGFYQIRPLPYYHVDTTRMSRFVKTNLHNLVPDYDYVVWIDANIFMAEDIKPLVDKFIKSKKPIGGIPHPLRNSVYAEGRACIRQGKDSDGLINQQLKFLKKQGYKSNELIESGFMIFDMKAKSIDKFFNTWWAQIDSFSRRDQLSLNYSIDTNGLTWQHLMEKPQDVRTYPGFAIVPHNVRQTAVYELEEQLGSLPTLPYNGRSFAELKKELLKSEAKRKVDVIYCVHNALEDVKKCLSSVVKYRKNPNLRIIIIDDGSDQPTKEFLEEFHNKNKSWSELHRKETGSGYTRAANRGLKATRKDADFMILLNSDTIVTDSWTEKMTHAAFSRPGVGIVGPMSSAASHQSIPNNKSSDNQTAVNVLPDGFTPEDMNKKCEAWSLAGFYPLVPLVHGFCLGMTREVRDTVGLFSEKHFPKGYGEENDFCFRATDLGFRLAIATNTYIYHAKSKSYMSEDRINYMKNGQQTLHKLHSKERVIRAVLSMDKNPTLNKLQSKAAELYK